MTILVDMDGVCTDYISAIEKELKRRNIEVLPREQITKSPYRDNYPEEIRNTVESVFEHVFSHKGLVRNLPMIEGTKEALEEMLKLGLDPTMCTAPAGDYEICMSEKIAWVKYHLGNEWEKRIIIARDKTRIKGDILIDDNPNIKGIYAPTWEHVIYDAPYNRHVKGKRRLTWENWREVLQI